VLRLIAYSFRAGMLSIVGYLEAPCLPIAVSPNRLNSAMACKQKLLVKLRGSYCHPVIRFCASRTYAKTLARNSEHSANNSKSKASLEHITNDNIQKEKNSRYIGKRSEDKQMTFMNQVIFYQAIVLSNVGLTTDFSKAKCLDLTQHI